MAFGSPTIATGRPEAMSANQVGSKPAVAGLEVFEHGGPFGMRCTEIRLTNVQVILVDNGATGSGGVQVYDWPPCLLDYFSASADLVLTATAGFTDAGLVAALGTQVAAADGTLAAVEADIAPSTAAPITTGAGTAKLKSTTALKAVHDGTATAKDLFLNFATANDPVGSEGILVNGTILVFWLNAGDN